MDRDEVDEQSRRAWKQAQREALLELTTHDDVVDGNFDAAIREITERSAEILDVTRVNVWLFDDEHDRVHCVDEFDRRTGEHSSGKELVAAEYPAYFEALESHRTIGADDAVSDPRTAELAQEYLRPNDIHALMDATLRSAGEVVGVICHEQFETTREWTDDEMQFAGDVADVIHRALRNRESLEQRRELEFRESLLKAQQEAFPDGVLVLGPDGDVLSHNERFRELWELPSSALSDGTTEDLVAHVRQRIEDPDAFTDVVEYLRENPRETAGDTVSLSDGRTFEWYATPVVGDTGRHYGRLWMVRDVTDRENRQRELELKNRAIDEAPIGIVLTDPGQDENPIVYSNEHFSRLTGYGPEEAIGRNCRFLQGENTKAEPVAEMRAAIDAHRPTTVELQNYRKDGSQFWNHVTLAPVEDEDGDVVNYVGFQQDVTERREATRQLQVLHRMLRHNLSNKMTIIRGNAEQVVRDGTDDTAAMASTIVEKSDQLIAITDKHRKLVQLLNERPTPEPVDLDELLTRSLADVREAHPDAKLVVDRSGVPPALAIPAIETAFRELVTNAVTSVGADAGEVFVEFETSAETVTIHISDTGGGLPEEEIQVLTGEQDVDPLSHGLGIGLWLTYWIVTLSQGTVSIEENEPRGTIISITLLRADGETDR